MKSITLRLAEAALLGCLAAPCWAIDLAPAPGGRLMAERVTDPGSYAVPSGPWREETGVPAIRAEGRVLRQSWRVDSPDLTTLQILEPLRDKLEASGYEILFDCSSARCGGFDFRFGTEVIPAPEMYVDLTAFRFLSARGPGDSYVTLLVSRSNAAGYVQVIQTSPTTAAEGAPEGETPAETPAPQQTPEAIPGGEIAARLEREGHVVLRDLSFESGSASLGETTVASLEDLATFLTADPSRRVLLVGHTDAVGSLAANTELSRKRAAAAESYLRARGIPAGQLGAQGAGYLSPVASNLTPEGREENRRIEAILLPSE
ncbi:OmpA family protein [Salipiger thiooxidans]|uniref:OmpA family protein n=1 Tax=Salipiger thiooxidans TaxID=282683 RepID=UPI001F5DF876|nr:OmpA family protein [Salipiger thiooxidans]